MRNDGLKKLLVVETNTHACKKITKKETDKNLKIIRETVLINYKHDLGISIVLQHVLSGN
jgi:hypothetical protein